jgi:hypothetical protein
MYQNAFFSDNCLLHVLYLCCFIWSLLS